jgi:putative ABC transport system ATP-binding protein
MMTRIMSDLITLKGVSKRYGSVKNPVMAVDKIDLTIPKGSFTIILGRSGSGKSTLLNLMAGLDKTTSGSINIDGVDLSKANPRSLANYRSKIGIIFQFYNLLPSLNTLDNVRMGAWAGGKQIDEAKAVELLTTLGLQHRIKANVKTLSGGEKQRVAIARSLPLSCQRFGYRFLGF